MMMPQDEEDLEDELKCLDIREDYGAEDSDVTPTNTPPLSPPVLYIKKYPPTKLGFQDYKDVSRYSRADDCDSRTESSMSWGDDEFEGEATRQVSVLFDQLEDLLYQEDLPLSPIPHSSSSHCHSSLSSSSSQLTLDKDVERNFKEQSLFSSAEKEDIDFSYGCDASNTSTSSPENDVDDVTSEFGKQNVSRYAREGLAPNSNNDIFFDRKELTTSEVLYENEHLFDGNTEIAIAEKPSLELVEECSSWVQHFPHFRVRGHRLDLEQWNVLESFLSEGVCEEYAPETEEIIAQEGDFYHLLPLVTFSSAKYGKKIKNEETKKEPSSRVCSGSNDPEVLKEQILIMLFDKLWSSVTEVIEPVLHQYAKYVIEQSVQYSSLSREPSTRGSRLVNHPPGSRRPSDEMVRTNTKYPLPSSAVHRPISSIYHNRDGKYRPMSGIRRPSSAANRLQSVYSMPEEHQEDLQDLLQVSPKPLQHLEDGGRRGLMSASRLRGSSAQSHLSQLSLPSLATPRTPIHRPVSSMASSHLLTPMRVENLASSGEQRPASTSSYNARARFQERLQNVNRQGTIQEMKGDSVEPNIPEELVEGSSSTWSRHISFLPPIVDEVDVTTKVNAGQQSGRRSMTKRRDSSTERKFSYVQEAPPTMTGEGGELSGLSVRGTTLPTHHPPHHRHHHHFARKHIMGSPITEGGRSEPLAAPHHNK